MIKYDYVKPKYREKAKLCYMDTESFIVYIKQMIYLRTFEKMLKLDLILQIMNQILLNLKVIGITKGELYSMMNHDKICWIKSENLQLLNR